MPSGDKAVIAIFASGTGSNADKICSYFHAHPSVNVGLVVSNRGSAGVFQIAAKHGIEYVYIPKKDWSDPFSVLPVLAEHGITHIVLAGFLLLIPEYLIHAFKGRIINIHPSLLPRHGGEGMYGSYVHQSVKISGDRVTGITIHEVNAQYDEGKIVFQKEIPIDEDDAPNDIARKVLELEHLYYPQVIEQWIDLRRPQGRPSDGVFSADQQ